jgi:hypothetical protein
VQGRIATSARDQVGRLFTRSTAMKNSSASCVIAASSAAAGRPAAQTLLALLLLSSCAPEEPAGTERAVDNKPGTSTGITTFGDARLGAVFD